jgi:hypothetical protein
MIKRKQLIILIAVLIAILVLEVLPYGAVLHFANPEGEPFRETFSYFDLTPYGYANFGPFITALLTCSLLVMSVVDLFLSNRRLKNALRIVTFVALIASLGPLLVNCYSIIGGAISILLLAVLIISMKKEESV